MEESIILSGEIYYSKGYIMLPVRLAVKDKLSMFRHDYFAKKEFHVSLVCTKQLTQIIARKNNSTEIDALSRILEIAKEALARKPIALETISKTFRKVVRDDRSSIIVLVKVRGLNNLINTLNLKLGLSLSLPPTHITLYTLANGLGIGVNTQEDFENLTSEIESDLMKLIGLSIKTY